MTYFASALVVHFQPVVASRVRLMVLPSTGAGASSSSQRIAPVPVATSPVTSILQLAVGLVPPINARVGTVPWLRVSSKPAYSAETSANPAVNLALAWYLVYMGKPIVAKMPMIATTINNSIKVKPF